MAQQKNNASILNKQDQAILIESSEKYLSDRMEKDKIVGLSAALIVGNKVIWKKGFGFADREKKIPMTINTVVNIGSITKTFTALSIMQLQEKGLIDLSHPLNSYLKKFHPKMQKGFDLDQVTVKSVLTHTSGIQSDIWKNSDLETGKYTDVVDFINDTYLLYPPGMIGLYSNAGYNLLGHTIKEISKEDYPSYIHKHIFSKLGMSRSGFAQDKLSDRSKLYAYGEVVKEYELRDIASGGIYTDMEDFTKYAIGLLDAYHGKHNGLIKEETIKKMFSLQNADIPLETNKKGLGWFMFRNDSVTAMYHAGSAGFAQAKLLLFPEKKAAVIVMTNTAEGSSAAEDFCFDMLPRFGLSIPDLFPAPMADRIHDFNPEINPVKESLKEHEGNYAVSGSYVSVSSNGDYLKMMNGDKLSILKPAGRYEYIPYIVKGDDTVAENKNSLFFFKNINGYHFLIKRIKQREYNLGYKLKNAADKLWMDRIGLYKQFGYQMLIGDSKFKSLELYFSKDHVLMCRLKTMGSTNEIPLDVIDDHTAMSSGVNSGFGGFTVTFKKEGQNMIADFAGITFLKSD